MKRPGGNGTPARALINRSLLIMKDSTTKIRQELVEKAAWYRAMGLTVKAAQLEAAAGQLGGGAR